MNRIALLGATGSIGRSALDVIGRHPERYRISVLSANERVEDLVALCLRWQPEHAVIAELSAFSSLRDALRAAGSSTQAHAGSVALHELAASDRCDTVIAAIVGAAGVRSTLAAAHSGKRVLLANKESVVVAGDLLRAAHAMGGGPLLPIDSEHNAVFQCLPQPASAAGGRAEIRRIVLTASGGPFRGWAREQLRIVSPDQACAHPNWNMGRKISVDSATLMNKGLEVIEAHWLFEAPAERIEVIVHPQSVVHSLVEYIDGSWLAQMGQPDMRTALAYGLAWPERIEAGVASLDLAALASLEFGAPDETTFPCLALARQALRAGVGACTVLNAANEIAVSAFLQGRIGFLDIPDLIAAALDRMGDHDAGTDLDARLALDNAVRQDVTARLAAQIESQR